jgi:hypothetical protein
MRDSWSNANSAVNMGGMVLNVPSTSQMLPLMKASDFNMHANPLSDVEFNCV